MASQNIARLGVVLGLDTAEFTAQVDKAISENRKLKDSIKRDSQAALKESAALKLAAEDYGKTLTKVQMIEREIHSGRYMNATKEMKAQLLERAKAYDAVANAAKNAATAEFKMNAQQKMGLTYQTTDVLTSLAAGQNPFIVLMQQGGQLKDQMGGLGNMFKAIGTLITPMSVAIGGASAAFGVFALAMYQANEEMKKFRNDMALTGQFAGIAYDEFINLGNSISQMANVSIGEARDALASLVGSGQFTRQSLDSVSKAVLQFGKLSGLSASEAASKLIPSLDGSASSAKRLNDTYHFLSLEQYKQIELLEKQGKQQEAIRLTADLLSQSFSKTTRDLGTLEAAWKGLTHWASSAWDAMLGFGRQPGMDRAQELQKKINDLTTEIEQRQSKGLKTGSQQAALQAFRNELNEITARVGAEMDRADEASKKAEKDSKGIKDYTENKGTRIQKANELAKATAEAEYATAVRSANETEKAVLEIQKKASEAYSEMQEKNATEFNQFSVQNAKIYEQKVIQIAQEGAAKITEIRSKARAAEIAEQNAEEQKQKDMKTDFDKMKADADWAAIQKTKSLQMSKEDLELRNAMLYASEKEIQLAQISLKYQREKEKPLANLEELKQQETLEKFNLEIQDSMKKSGQVFDTVWGNMSSAIDNFVKTGKLSMKDFARSVIQDLIAIQMKAQAVALLRGLFGSYNSMMGYSQATSYASTASAGWLGFANGGEPPVNTPSIVGEKGPEIFVPRTAGTIIPNNQLGGMGATTNVTNNYINAIDTKSFEDRLLGSSNAIWAANQYANKSLAVNRGRA
jgi:phage-related minor tail protein